MDVAALKMEVELQASYLVTSGEREGGGGQMLPERFHWR